MGLVEIKTFNDLLKFLPFLVKAFKELDGRWEEGTSVQDFVALLTKMFFEKNSHFYGIHDGKTLYYFIALVEYSPEKTNFWLFYVDKNKRQYTSKLIQTLKSEIIQMGYKTAIWTTNRMTRSYDRWVTKLGAEKNSINYKLEL